MIRLLDLSYHTAPKTKTAAQLLNEYEPAIGFAALLPDPMNIRFIKHAQNEENINRNRIDYTFLKGKNSFWHNPAKAHELVKAWKPDVIIVQGFVFPIQLILLRRAAGNDCKIVVQHHGEKPFSGIKKLVQKYALSKAHAFIFTAALNATNWQQKGLIKPNQKVHELLEASTNFSQKDKHLSLQKTGMSGSVNFLWVGRLNTNKDPLTVLKAFEKYLTLNADARLHMIYQTDELLGDIKKMLIPGTRLHKAVLLKGKIPHSELPYWYSAADFYISASHKEGSGYALLEAMACGCIPIVSDIPSFRKITDQGRYGFLFAPGNHEQLLQTLHKLDGLKKVELSKSIIGHFKKQLSFQKIADDLQQICLELNTK